MKISVLLFGLICFVSSGCAQQKNETQKQIFGRGKIIAQLQAPELEEISGFTSASNDRHFFALTDSGTTNSIFELDNTMKITRRFPIQGVINRDWEDLAHFEQNGQRYLLIAETGDNLREQKNISLIAVPEPDSTLADGAPLSPKWILRLRYPDGSVDCEAIAIDSQRNEILLISKREPKPRLFSVKIPHSSNEKIQTLKLLGSLNGIENPSRDELKNDPISGRFRSQVTGATSNRASNTLAVLTYRGVYIYSRKNSESWARSIRRKPQFLSGPLLPQAEAVSFSEDGKHLLVTSERVPNSVLRFSVKY